MDYMALYSRGNGIHPFSGENEFVFRIGDSAVRLNGKPVALEPALGAAAVARGGTAYLPVRFLAEAVGGTVSWDPVRMKAAVSAPQLELEFAIGDAHVTVNGERRTLDGAPILSRGRAMLPARFIGEALGFDVAWNAEENAVVLTLP